MVDQTSFGFEEKAERMQYRSGTAASTVVGGGRKTVGLPRGLVLVEAGAFAPGLEPSVAFLRAN